MINITNEYDAQKKALEDMKKEQEIINIANDYESRRIKALLLQQKQLAQDCAAKALESKRQAQLVKKELKRIRSTVEKAAKKANLLGEETTPNITTQTTVNFKIIDPTTFTIVKILLFQSHLIYQPKPHH